MYDEQNVCLNGLLHRRETVKTVVIPGKLILLLLQEKGLEDHQQKRATLALIIHYTTTKALMFMCVRKHFVLFGPKRLQVLRWKLESGKLELDGRGKHSNHPAVDNKLKDMIREHIKSVPSRQSHYSRKDNSQRVYLPPDLSITRLHYNFLEKYDPEYIQLQEEHRKCVIAHEPPPKLRKPLVTEHLYHDIFVTEFNGYPRTDTCFTCDRLIFHGCSLTL